MKKPNSWGMEFTDDLIKFATIVLLTGTTAFLVYTGRVNSRAWDSLLGFALGAGTVSIAAKKK